MLRKITLSLIASIGLQSPAWAEEIEALTSNPNRNSPTHYSYILWQNNATQNVGVIGLMPVDDTNTNTGKQTDDSEPDILPIEPDASTPSGNNNTDAPESSAPKQTPQEDHFQVLFSLDAVNGNGETQWTTSFGFGNAVKDYGRYYIGWVLQFGISMTDSLNVNKAGEMSLSYGTLYMTYTPYAAKSSALQFRAGPTLARYTGFGSPTTTVYGYSVGVSFLANVAGTWMDMLSIQSYNINGRQYDSLMVSFYILAGMFYGITTNI